MDQLKVFSGSANRPLAQEICDHLHVSLGESEVDRFSDGEIYFQIQENVRGQDVFIVQPTCHPVNENLVELLLMIDAFKRSSARRITPVIPYYGYARQDRKDKPRVPISSRLVADLIQAAGATRLLTMDLHAGQIQGFFDIPVDHLFAAPVILEYVSKLNLPDLTVVAPDAGGVERARAYAKRLDASLVIMDKRRVQANVAEVMHVIGEVEGKTALIIDDMIDTAGTLIQAAEALLKQGARKVYAAATHAVLSGSALDRINGAGFEQVIVTNSIPLNGKQSPKLKVLSIAWLLGEAIQSIHEETSVSKLFV
ncbi:MAG: ribose-phosphate pyrophosphokinase [Acidobacteria bacterium]|nr:ribose-phosphate pyrophosphokinase [Acidobacteriota bacterium]